MQCIAKNVNAKITGQIKLPGYFSILRFIWQLSMHSMPLTEVLSPFLSLYQKMSHSEAHSDNL